MTNRDLVEEILRRLRETENSDIWITDDDEIYTDSEHTHNGLFITLDSLGLDPLSDSEVENGIEFYGIHFI